MKKRINTYTFDASEKQITLTGITIQLDALLLVTNLTDNIIIFNFADETKTATVAGSVITLAYDTAAMSDSDELQIFYDDAVSYPITDSELRASAISTSDASVFTQLQTLNTNDATFMLRHLISVMSDPVYLNKVSNALQVLLLSGSTTAVTGTLTGVTTVTGLTNIGGYGADQVNENLKSIAWESVRGLLS